MMAEIEAPNGYYEIDPQDLEFREPTMGYFVQFNECRPDAEDSFEPMTNLRYGSADKGFNWWEESISLSAKEE